MYKFSEEFNKQDLNGTLTDVFVPEIENTIPLQYRGKIQYRYMNPTPNKYDPLAQIGYIGWKYSVRHTHCDHPKFFDLAEHGWKKA